MTTVKQHIPGFVTGVDPAEAQFDTLEDLLAVPFVRQWSDARLERFSIADDASYADLLMAEMKDGKFWVVGFIDKGAAPPQLPIWHDASPPSNG